MRRFRRMFGVKGAAGHEGPVDDLDVARPQAAELARDLDLVLLGDEGAEQGPHVLDLGPQRVVEDGVLVHPGDVAALLVEEALERALLLQGGPVVGLGGVDGLADLLLERVPGRVEPGLELDHLRIVRPVDPALLLVIGLDLAVGRLQGLDGRVADGLGQGVDVELAELAVDGLLGVPLDLGRRQGRVDGREVVDDGALVVAEIEEVLLLAVLLEVLLLPLEVLPQEGDLLGQELGGLLGRLVARLDGEVDELLDQGVDDVGGQGGVGRDVADVDEPGLGDGRDAQSAEDGEGVARVGGLRGPAGRAELGPRPEVEPLRATRSASDRLVMRRSWVLK